MRIFLILMGLGVVGLVGYNVYLQNKPKSYQFFYGEVGRADVIDSVGVTGYAEPRKVTLVEADVPGEVEEVLVTYGDEVKKGDVLAVLNSEMQAIQVEQAEKNLALAESAVLGSDELIKAAEIDVNKAKQGIKAAEAGIDGATSALSAADRQWRTARESADKGLIPTSKVDTALDLKRKAQALVDQANSQLRVRRDELAQAEIQVFAAKVKKKSAEVQRDLAAVTLKQAKFAKEKMVLKANMDGIILNMDITEGGRVGLPRLSVGGAMNPLGGAAKAPSKPRALFEIAADLSKMHAVVYVGESDTKNVRVGQEVTFTVDAYPDVEMKGIVKEFRYTGKDPTGVSYETIVEFDNKEDASKTPPKSMGKLPKEWMVRPRATVSAEILIRRAKNVLSIPNEALLYSPTDGDAIPSVGDDERVIWVDVDGHPEHRVVKVGISDENRTELIGGELKEGDKIITGEPLVEEPKPRILPIGN